MKRKWSLLVNIGLVCLCLCAIAVGVYSAKTATMEVSGAINFTSNDCKVKIVASMSGGSEEEATFKEKKIENEELTIDGKTNTSAKFEIGEVYFNDYYKTTPYKPVADIVFTFTITNNSKFYIDATVNEDFRTKAEESNVYVYAPNLGETIAPNGSYTFTIKFQLQRQADGTFPSKITRLALDDTSSPIMTFTKCDPPAYLASDWKDKIASTFNILDATLEYSNGQSYTVPGIKATSKISFIKTTGNTPAGGLISGFETNDDGTYKYAIVGANSLNGNAVSSEGGYNENISLIRAYYNSTTKEIIISSPSRIYVGSCSELFVDWGNLQNCNLDNFDTSNITNMKYMFAGAWRDELVGAKFTTLDVSKLDTSKVTDMTNMFYACEKLTSLDMRNFNTEILEDVSDMMARCSLLREVKVSNWNTSTITNIYGIFFYCTSLLSLDLSSFNITNANDIGAMFCNSSNIQTIYTNSSWAIKEGINSDNMFLGCTSLVGGNGTRYNSSKTDVSYACIDGEYEQTGYFTRRDII